LREVTLATFLAFKTGSGFTIQYTHLDAWAYLNKGVIPTLIIVFINAADD
jgi:hypothetical protein